jgi:hypothetical protein
MASELNELLAPWIAERASAREAEWAARRERKAVERIQRKAARDAGLIKRYARKAARSQPRPSIT